MVGAGEFPAAFEDGMKVLNWLGKHFFNCFYPKCQITAGINGVFLSFSWLINSQLTEILTAGEGCNNTTILSIKLLLRETSREACKNNPFFFWCVKACLPRID